MEVGKYLDETDGVDLLFEFLELWVVRDAEEAHDEFGVEDERVLGYTLDEEFYHV